MMKVIREISVEDTSLCSDSGYVHFQAEDNSGIIQQLPRTLQKTNNVFTALHLKKINSLLSLKCCSYSKCFKIFVAVGMVILIWLAAGVPSIFYFRSQWQKSTSLMRTWPQNVSADLCTLTQIYTGSACRRHLTRLQSCLADQQNPNGTTTFEDNIMIYLSPLGIGHQMEYENYVSYLQTIGLQTFESSITEECLREIIPLLCLSFFPLTTCNWNKEAEAHEVIGPGRQSCISVRDGVCKDLWKTLTNNIFISSLLPDCDLIFWPHLELLEKCEDDVITDDDNRTELNCTQDFIPFNQSEKGILTCTPECQRWSPFTPQVVQMTDILVIISAALALITGCAVQLLGCLRCKKIYSYPSIFIIYQTISVMILAALVLVGFSARSQLFCSSPSLPVTLAHPTAFCKATGVAFHYFLLQSSFWWICHVIGIFLKMLFPYKVRQMEFSMQLGYIHASMVAVSLILPMGSVIGVAARGGFNLTRHPTFLCVGTDQHVIFALVVVPISAVIAVGATLMVFILWTVIKRHIQAHVYQLRILLDWAAEIKIFSVLIYYLILGIVVITNLTKAHLNLHNFFEEMSTYFACESRGISNDTLREVGSGNLTLVPCDRKAVEQLSDPIFTTLTFVLLGLYPSVYLMYIVSFKEWREKLQSTQREGEVSNTSSCHSINCSGMMTQQATPTSSHSVTNNSRGADIADKRPMSTQLL